MGGEFANWICHAIEPGGFIQWGEYDLPKRKVVRARLSNSAENVVALQKFITGAVKTPL